MPYKTIFCLLLYLFPMIFHPVLYGQKPFHARAEYIINFAADIYQVPRPNYMDPEKVYWPVTIARLQKYGIDDTVANSYIALDEFVERNPFHFILVGMARLMPLFPHAPEMEKYRFDYLNNVYNRHDSYNPWTCEGTENHISMSRTSGYIFAQIMEKYPERYPKALQFKQMMKKWIRYYSKRIYEVGAGEFNAGTYGIFNIIGWLNLFDFADDNEVRLMARAVLDYYAVEIALHYTQGMTGGSESRGAPTTKACHTETDYLAWLWYNDSPKPIDKNFFNDKKNKHPLQVVHAATSNYRPPEIARPLAMKRIHVPAFYKNSKPSYLLAKASYIKQHFYISHNFTLGTAYYPYGAFTTAAYKNVTWKLVSRVDSGQGKNPDLVTGGGTFYPDRQGKVRNPWLQTVQHKNVLIQMNNMPKNAGEIYEQIEDTIKVWAQRWKRDFIKRYGRDDEKIRNKHLYPVKFMESGNTSKKGNGCYLFIHTPRNIKLKDKMLFVELEKSFLAIRSFNSVPQLEGNLIMDFAPPGLTAGIVMETGDSGNFGNFQHFIDSVMKKSSLDLTALKNEHSIVYQSVSGDVIEATYGISGSFTEPLYDWGYGPETPQLIQSVPPFQQPEWPSGKGHERLATWAVNGKTVNLQKHWPVYSGPAFSLNNSVLQLRDENENVYCVDYSGYLPVFKE